MRPDLLRWQWSDYATKHQDRVNLLLHIVAVPAFELSSITLLIGLATISLRLVAGAALGALIAFAIQGLGHRRERSQPEPFLGAGDAVSRILAEQWITFPRFVFSGGWFRSFRGK
jgi:hypothetical protein